MKKWEFVNDPFHDTFRELFITFINLKNELHDCLELKSSYNERLNNKVKEHAKQLLLKKFVDEGLKSFLKIEE